MNFKEPFIIINSDLVSIAVNKWNLDYLKNNFTELKCNVFRSKTKEFLYWDETKIKNVDDFKKPTQRMQISFDEFHEKLLLTQDDW